jgi:hypothetical protein
MKIKFACIVCLIMAICFAGCSKDEKITYGKNYIIIDSICNITKSSATIKATFTLYEKGTVNISGFSAFIGRTWSITDDSLHQELSFNNSDGKLEIVANGLKSNTMYYVMPVVRYDVKNIKPPFAVDWIGDTHEIKTFTTK